MAFAILIMRMSIESMFGCSALVGDLPCGLVLLEETLAFFTTSVDRHDLPPLEVPALHCKDPFLP